LKPPPRLTKEEYVKSNNASITRQYDFQCELYAHKEPECYYVFIDKQYKRYVDTRKILYGADHG
jgi:hypothetical protein